MAGLFDTPTTPTLRRLLEEVAIGAILIPEFQRPFVWSDQQRLDLLDSVARGLPIGALMVWRTRTHRLQCYSRLGPFELPAPADSGPWTYLIDGHQRLTTLIAALRRVDDEAEFTPEVRWPIQIDLRETPPQFVLPGRGQSRPRVLPANTLASNATVYQAQRALWEVGAEAEATRLEELASSFRDYVIPLIPLVSEDITLVTHAFARVNRSGTSMSEAHLAAALAYGSIPLRSELSRAAQTTAELGWPLGQAALLNGLKLLFDLDVYRAPTTELLAHLGASSKDPILLRSSIRRLLDGLREAFKVLRQAGVMGPASLPYTYQPLLLAIAQQRLGRPLAGTVLDRGVKWFWQTTFTEAFTGATGTTFRRALDGLTEWLANGSEPASDQPVRQHGRHSKWGSVRTIARMLTVARSGGEDLLELLGRQGSQVVHKLLPDLPRDRSGSWVIATSEVLLEARESIAFALRPPHMVQRQLAPGAWDALQKGDVGRFLELQDDLARRIEAEQILASGLAVEPPRGS